MAFSLKNFTYHEWLNKTHFSFLSSTTTPFDLVQTAINLEYGSICINDFDGVYGIARCFNDHNFISQKTPNSLKLNYGAEIHLQQDHESPLMQQVTLVLNVFNQTGYRNLCRLLSMTHKESKDKAWISLVDLLEQNLNGIFGIIPMRGGLYYFHHHPEELPLLKELLKDNLCLALTKTFNRRADQLIPIVYELSQRFELPILISQDSFMLKREDKSFHDVLLAIKNNQIVSQNLTHQFTNGERSLHTKNQIYQTYKGFKGFEQSCRFMQWLDERCDFTLGSLKYQYPQEMIPEGYTSQSFLEKVTFDCAHQRYGDIIPAKVIQLLSKELDLIEELGFADYFLTVWDIVRWARSQDILCQGRGSAANSAVCFVLGVTACDPSLFDLLFERFMSKERGDPPDIDIDFEHERREEVLQYIYRRYGRKRAAMVANVITFRSKGAVRAVGKALGVPEDVLAQSSKALSTVIYRKEDITSVVDIIRKNQNLELPWKLWAHYAEKLLDFPRHMGIHSGGFIISQHEIDDLVPQEPATMEARTVIQWSKDDIEELGFFKIDCLSLGMLTAVRKCLDDVKKCYGKHYELHQIPQDDPPTYQMIQKADTVGVFQIESRAQQEMAPRFKPRDLYDLVIQIATIRPGPLEGDAKNPLIRRRNGEEAITYPCPEVEEILSRTMGVLVFQEQLMRIAVALGDFTPGEANELRKNIGAWNSKAFNRNLNPFMQKLFNGLKRKGVKKEFALQLMQQMKGFAHYGFPESHAISFAFIAYASAYLKCHYPAAFFTSILNSQPMGFYSPHALLEAAKRAQVTILPLCVKHSYWDHQLEPLPAKNNRPTVYAIRLGFRLISGLRVDAVKHMENTDRNWRDFKSFIQQTTFYKDDYLKLASANALHSFGFSREDAIWKCSAVPFKELIDTKDKEVRWAEKSALEQAQQDFEAFGTTLGEHPVALIKTKHWPYSIKLASIKSAKTLEDFAHGFVVSVFGMLISKQAPPSAKGMVFFTLEDETGFLNLVFTPQVYRRFHEELEQNKMLCVSGILQKNQQAHSVLVKTVHLPKALNVTILKRSQQLKATTPQGFNADKINYH